MNQKQRVEIIRLFLAGQQPRSIEARLGLTGQLQKVYETIEAARRKGIVPRKGIRGRPKKHVAPADAGAQA
jgi:hypothetical protein